MGSRRPGGRQASEPTPRRRPVVAAGAAVAAEAEDVAVARASRPRCPLETAPSPRCRPRRTRSEDEIDAIASAPKAPRTTPFGSVWDSQLGTPTPPASGTFAPLTDDEDLDEPEIPEYLIAEQRRGGRASRWPGRQPRTARRSSRVPVGHLARAIWARRGWRHQPLSRRERSNGRATSGPLVRPGRRRPGRPRRTRSIARRRRGAGPGNVERGPAGARGELRAQLANKVPATAPLPQTAPSVAETAPPASGAVAPAAPKPRTPRRSTAASAKAAATADASPDGTPAPPKRRTTRKAAGTDGDVPVTAEAAPAAPKRRTTRKATGSAGAEGEVGTEGAAPKAAPKAGRPASPPPPDRSVDGARTRGHGPALAAIEAMVRGTPPHAILLSGPGGVGKTTLALDLAAGLLCVAADPTARPCRACRGCRLIEHGDHPDLHRLAPEGPGGQIVIGGPGAAYRGVRDLIADLVLAAPRRRARASRSWNRPIG